MEGNSKEGAPRDEEQEGQSDLSEDMLDPRLWRGVLKHEDEAKSQREAGQTITSDVIPEDQADSAEPQSGAQSVSPSIFMDTYGPSISSLSCSDSSTHPHPNLSSSPSSSSSSSILSLTPPLPPSVELPAVLTDSRLTLDVYQGGAAVLPLLWRSIPEQLMGVQYLRLGSEDKPGLDGALDVLHYLRDLRSLAVRGTFMISFVIAAFKQQ